jgi:hypothetical protein
MQEAADKFLDQNLHIIEIKQQILELQQYYFSQETLTTLALKVDSLERSLNNAQLAFSSSTSLLDLINSNASKIDSILSGNLPANLTVNTNVINQGDGILLDRSVPNQIRVYNRNQNYNNFMLCGNSSGYIQTNSNNGQDFNNLNDNNILVLGTFNNYFKQKNTDPETGSNPNRIIGVEYFDDTLYINIDDKNIRWKNGQTLKFVFDEKIDVNSHNIIFRTDSQNIFGQGAYNKTMVIISPSMLISDRPIFEIYCIDENQYLFNIDVIR